MNSLDSNTISTEMVPNTYALGHDSMQNFIDDIRNFGNECIDYDLEHSKQLLVGAVIVSEIRKSVFEETGYKCSAGIGCNKILAKLVCGMNKPNKQTILPKHSINILYRTLSIKKVKHLGAKFGDDVCRTLNISKMSELQKFTEKQLQAKFGEKNGTWLHNIARGIDSEPVQARFNSKSIGCCKQLRGKSALADLDSLKNWLKDLSEEIEDRLEKDSVETNRTPKQMVVSFTAQFHDGRDVNSSRSHNFTSEDEICPEFIAAKALELILDSTELNKPKEDENNRKLKTLIKFLAISVGKFEEKDDGKKTRKISDFLLTGSPKTVMKNTESFTKKNLIVECPVDKDFKKMDKNKEGKKFIFQKFLQGCNKVSEATDEMNKNESSGIKRLVEHSETVTQASLDQQELFFQRFLNGNYNKISTSDDSESSKNVEKTEEKLKQISNEYNADHHNGSNDSNYSGSTINDEINKSVSLFKDEPFEANRISDMRNMLGSSAHIVEENNIKSRMSPKASEALEKNERTTFCSDCKKNISFVDLLTHSDYHMALKLREEERKARHLEREAKINKKCPTDIAGHSKSANDSNSITNFFVKFNTDVPLETCSECSSKIPLEKLTEHLDFHEAQKLSRELNRKVNNISKTIVMRKRKSTSPEKRQKVPRRTIESFFTNA